MNEHFKGRGFFLTWLSVTLIFVFIEAYLFLNSGYNDYCQVSCPAYQVWLYMGPFVPIGLNEFFFGFLGGIYTSRFLVLVPVMLLLLSFYYADLTADRLGLRAWPSRIVWYLFILFVITMATNFATYGNWTSVNILLGQPFTTREMH